NPEGRYPSMEGLLDELERDPRTTQRRWMVAGGVAALVVLLPIFHQLEQSRVQQRCNAASKLEGIWDDPTRARVENAFQKTGLVYAHAAFRTIEGQLNGYTQEWASMDR